MAKMVLIIGAVVEFGRGLACFLISRRLVYILDIWYSRQTVPSYYSLGAALLVFGIFFLMASRDPRKHRFALNMGLLFYGVGFISYFLMLARLGSLDIFWWIMAALDLVLWILFFVARKKTVSA